MCKMRQSAGHKAMHKTRRALKKVKLVVGNQLNTTRQLFTSRLLTGSLVIPRMSVQPP